MAMSSMSKRVSTPPITPEVDQNSRMRIEMQEAEKATASAYQTYKVALQEAAEKVERAQQLYEIAQGESRKLLSLYQLAANRYVGRVEEPHDAR